MGRGYTIFDTAIGRSAIVWSDGGIVGVHLPEAREIDTRRRVYQLYPEARELRPPMNTEIAIEGIAAQLQGRDGNLSDVTLDTIGIHVFNRRVYEITRKIPRGETRGYEEIATRLGAPSAARSVEQAVAKNPFMIIVPCHRVLDSYEDKISPNGGTISRRLLLSIEGSRAAHSKTLFGVLLPVAPPRPHN